MGLLRTYRTTFPGTPRRVSGVHPRRIGGVEHPWGLICVHSPSRRQSSSLIDPFAHDGSIIHNVIDF
jgi:hypothetical protein